VPVVVENKPGASGAIAGDYVAKSNPDGYTLLSDNAGLALIIPVTEPEQFPGRKDLDLVCKVGGSPFLLAVKADSPFKMLEDMLNFAKKNPGKLTYGSTGHASLSYFSMEILKLRAGADVTFVPTAAGTTNSVALLGGHVDMIFDTFGPQRGLIESGTVRALAVVPKTHFLPNVPSFAEKGFSEVPTGFIPMCVRKGTPKPILEKLMQALGTVCKSPGVVSQSNKLGFNLDFRRAEDVSKDILSVHESIREVVKKGVMSK